MQSGAEDDVEHRAQSGQSHGPHILVAIACLWTHSYIHRVGRCWTWGGAMMIFHSILLVIETLTIALTLTSTTPLGPLSRLTPPPQADAVRGVRAVAHHADESEDGEVQ